MCRLAALPVKYPLQFVVAVYCWRPTKNYSPLSTFFIDSDWMGGKRRTSDSQSDEVVTGESIVDRFQFPFRRKKEMLEWENKLKRGILQ